MDIKILWDSKFGVFGAASAVTFDIAHANLLPDIRRPTD